MPLNASSGFAPSKSSLLSRSAGDLQSLYFKTTVLHHHDGRQQTKESRIENFDAIHKMGTKNTKYMKHRVKEAPGLDRESTHHFRTYGPKPLGDHVCNKELAETFKGAGAAPSIDIDFGNRTSYHENFNVPRTQAHFAEANLPNQAPDKKMKTKTLGGTGKTMVHLSKSQSDHIQFPMHKSTECATPKPNFMLGGITTNDTYRTSYGSDFGRPWAATNNLDDLFSELRRERRGEKREVKEEDRMFTFRRSCFLAPGQ